MGQFRETSHPIDLTAVNFEEAPVVHEACGFFERGGVLIMPASDADLHRCALLEAIARGVFPRFALSVEIMPDVDAKCERLNPFDLSKTWPHADCALIKGWNGLSVLVQNRALVRPSSTSAET